MGKEKKEEEKSGEEKKKDNSDNSGKEKKLVQPEVNIGLIGHVDHGKTTITERLSGRWTDTHSEELKRGITIRLGYADTTFRKCPKGEGASAYTVKETCSEHEVETEPLRKVSFVDAPGHESLMATMLTGATLMDGAVLIIGANEACPQPQTKEHLMALQISGIENLVVVQNKIDLVSEEKARRNYEQIKEFLSETEYEDAPVIPMCAVRGINISYLIEAIEERIPTPERDEEEKPLLLAARSFDINKPGSPPSELRGGVLGGTIKKGVLKKGDTIEIRPGRIVEEANQIRAKPIETEITNIQTGGESVEKAGPGGSLAVMTSLDPSLTNSDSLSGNLVGHPDELPRIWYDLWINPTLLDRVVGVTGSKEVNPLVKDELLMLNVNGEATTGVVKELSKERVKCELKNPISADPDDRVTISRKIGTRFRLIGYGTILEEE